MLTSRGLGLLLTLLPFLACADSNDLYSEHEVRSTLSYVATRMQVEIDHSRELPKVVNVLTVDRARYDVFCPFCNNIRINFYAAPHREIWILPGRDLGVLCHELVHYLQVEYQRGSNRAEYAMEEQAVSIQNDCRNNLVRELDQAAVLMP